MGIFNFNLDKKKKKHLNSSVLKLMKTREFIHIIEGHTEIGHAFRFLCYTFLRPILVQRKIHMNPIMILSPHPSTT